MAASKKILGMVCHLLRDEEQREFFGMVKEQIAAALITHDVLLERELKRLGRIKFTNREVEHDTNR